MSEVTKAKMGRGALMQNVKYHCPWCLYESEVPNLCPNCRVPLLPRCPVCGNLIVGVHVCQWTERYLKVSKEAGK